MQNALNPVGMKHVEITDALFGHYVSMIADTVLPYQWEALNGRVSAADDTTDAQENASSCIHSFRVAAGELSSAHQGAAFQDSDAYKWLEATAYCIQLGKGENLVAHAEELIRLIARAQQPDGYLNTYFTCVRPDLRWKNLAEGHELYCAGHLIEAAVAYYRATGAKKLLDVATRFADLIATVFGPNENQHKGIPGHQEIELALIKLYRVTGERRYLELARHFLSQRGKDPDYLIHELEANKSIRFFPEFVNCDAEYFQTHLPVALQETAEGHAVRAMYMYCAMADIAAEYDDSDLREACLKLWHNVTAKRMYITGGIGSSGLLERFTVDYDLPNDRMYCETCASIGLMMFGQRMNLITHDAAYYDVVERALCNTVLAGVSMEGDRYFYVNPLEIWPSNCKASTSMSHVKPIRQKWFPCACCPPNIARTLASLGQYIYRIDERHVYINQFISSKMTASMGEAEVAIEMDASYMVDGRVRLTINCSRAHSFTVRVRIPPYFKRPTFQSEGSSITPLIENGYAVLAVSRVGTQTFELQGSVTPEFVAANDMVRADNGKVAVMLGPYVYCLEETDNGKNLAAVYVNTNAEIKRGAPLKNLPGNLPTLHYSGKRLEQRSQSNDCLYGATDFSLAEADLTASPYCLWCNRTPGEMLVWQKVLL